MVQRVCVVRREKNEISKNGNLETKRRVSKKKAKEYSIEGDRASRGISMTSSSK